MGYREDRFCATLCRAVSGHSADELDYFQGIVDLVGVCHQNRYLILLSYWGDAEDVADTHTSEYITPLNMVAHWHKLDLPPTFPRNSGLSAVPRPRISRHNPTHSRHRPSYDDSRIEGYTFVSPHRVERLVYVPGLPGSRPVSANGDSL